jgi:hypothetical protein
VTRPEIATGIGRRALREPHGERVAGDRDGAAERLDHAHGHRCAQIPEIVAEDDRRRRRCDGRDVELRAADEGPHTFTVVAAKDEPKTAQQLFGCKICEKLAKAHGADPNSNAPPKYPFLENGVGQATAPSVNQPGDSGVTGKGKKGESIDLKVTAPAGTKLRFMCLIHPWMQAEVDVT